MKIGLVGAPDSGKRRLAEALQDGLGSARIISGDEYVNSVERDTDIACKGYLAPYLGDIAVAISRYGKERKSADDADHVITCGTLVETTVYTAISLTLTQDEWSWAVSNVVMPLYGLMATTLLDYDLVLRLPLTDPQTDLDAALDRELDGALENLQVKYFALPAWDEGQLEAAVALINGTDE